MLKRKTQQPISRKWPYTPEPSPPLKATQINIIIKEDIKMSSEHSSVRPINVSKERAGTLTHSSRPTLNDVLEGRAPEPYTLAAYTAFLTQQHCLETLEFVTESQKYGEKHDEYIAHYSGMPMTSDTDEGFELMQDWTRLMDVYVKPGAPREINLPAEERDDLIDEPYQTRPPKPETLEPAMQRMRDLMSDSIFIPFCNSVRTTAHASTYTPGQTGRDSIDPATATLDERKSTARKQGSSRTKSPSSSSSGFSRSPPQKSNTSSALSSALNRPASLKSSTLFSNTSTQSNSGLADSNESTHRTSTSEQDSTMTPPLSPPNTNIPGKSSSGSYTYSAKSTRSDSSGGWKKMGMKIFGQTKK